MDCEKVNMKAEAKAYYEDMAAAKEAARIEAAEAARISWAQRYGNDSGFDPYWDIQED